MAGKEQLSHICSKEYSEFRSLAIEGWEPDADAALVNLVAEMSQQTGKKTLQIADFIPTDAQLGRFCERWSVTNEEALDKLVARFVVLGHVNHLVSPQLQYVNMKQLSTSRLGRVISEGRRFHTCYTSDVS